MPRTVRKSLIAGAAFLLPAAAVGVAASASTAAAATHAASFPAHYSAPYLQISSSDAKDMAADMAASGDKFYTLAFLTPKSGCTPEWEDGGDSVGAFSSQITALQNAGGNVIISFGGAEGGELAQTCTSVSSLEAAYAKVVSTYHVTRLDFDIEGGVLDNKTANSRRDQALAALQKANPSCAGRLHAPGRSHRPGVQRHRAAVRRQEQGRRRQPRQHHDDGLRRRSERAEGRRVRRQRDRPAAREGLRRLQHQGLEHARA